MTPKAAILGGSALAVAAFLLGFVPQYVKTRGLANQLAAARRESQWQDLTLSIGSVFLQTEMKNYGLAGQASSGFFDRLGSSELQSDATPEQRKFLQSAAAQRDAVTAGLAKGDASVLGSVEALFEGALQADKAQ